MNNTGFERIAVIGAGTMGAGIAGLFARSACRVTLLDVDRAALDRGLARLDEAQAALVAAGRLEAAQARAARARITPTLSREAACADAELLIEAVAEDMDIKQALFRDCDRFCPDGAILTSNTSGLSITRIAAATRRPEAVAGLHFWNPPHLVPLVEVTKGRLTAAATAERLLETGRGLGKRPILVRHDVPGFVGNRLQFAVFREALHILAEGIASAADIDTAMTAGPGFRYGLLGPLRTADLGGLDVFLAISKYLFPELSAARQPAVLLETLVRKGALGAKTQDGFYSYSPAEWQDIIARRDRVLLELLPVLQPHRPEPGAAGEAAPNVKEQAG